MRVLQAAGKLLFVLLAAGCAVDRAGDMAASEPPHPEFVELGADGIGSPFTKETVLRLNAIVEKSLEIITDYDREIPGLRRLISAASAKGATASDKRNGAAAVERLGDFSARASAARREMALAVAELKTRGERHNEAILAGMVAFVEKVDEEISTETEAMRSRFGDAMGN